MACCCCSPLKPPTNCAINIRLGFAIYGVIGGIMVFFTFGFQFHNWNAAVWGLCSGIYAGFSLFVEVTYKRTQWRRYSNHLIWIAAFSCIGIVAGLTGFPIYLTYAILEKQGVTAEERSFYVVCVWCALTFKNALFVFISSLSYYWLQRRNTNLTNSTSDTQSVVCSEDIT